MTKHALKCVHEYKYRCSGRFILYLTCVLCSIFTLLAHFVINLTKSLNTLSYHITSVPHLTDFPVTPSSRDQVYAFSKYISLGSLLPPLCHIWGLVILSVLCQLLRLNASFEVRFVGEMRHILTAAVL